MLHAPVSGFTAAGDKKLYTVKGLPFEVPQQYDVVGLLGAGSYGTVCSAVDTTDGTRVAIKKCTRLDEDDRAVLALRELEVLSFVQHPNVVSLTTVFPTAASRSADPRAAERLSEVYASMPLLDTTLSTVLRSRQPLAESHRRYFAYQLVCGMHYLHTAGIIHADLKPANLLVNLDCSLKIADYGLAQFSCGPEHKQLPYVVTPPYRAPELLVGNTSYGPGIDVWAAGCIVAELYTRSRRLFTYSESRQAMLAEVTAVCGWIPEDVVQHEGGRDRLRRLAHGTAASSSLADMLGAALPTDPTDRAQLLDFLGRMLDVDPRTRATAAELLQHPYLAVYATVADLQPAPCQLLGMPIASYVDEEGRAAALRAIQQMVNHRNPHTAAAVAAAAPAAIIAPPSPEELPSVDAAVPRRPFVGLLLLAAFNKLSSESSDDLSSAAGRRVHRLAQRQKKRRRALGLGRPALAIAAQHHEHGRIRR
jgi:serine/threonine protein kinase